MLHYFAPWTMTRFLLPFLLFLSVSVWGQTPLLRDAKTHPKFKHWQTVIAKAKSLGIFSHVSFDNILFTYSDPSIPIQYNAVLTHTYPGQAFRIDISYCAYDSIVKQSGEAGLMFLLGHELYHILHEKDGHNDSTEEANADDFGVLVAHLAGYKDIQDTLFLEKFWKSAMRLIDTTRIPDRCKNPAQRAQAVVRAKDNLRDWMAIERAAGYFMTAGDFETSYRLYDYLEGKLPNRRTRTNRALAAILQTIHQFPGSFSEAFPHGIPFILQDCPWFPIKLRAGTRSDSDLPNHLGIAARDLWQHRNEMPSDLGATVNFWAMALVLDAYNKTASKAILKDTISYSLQQLKNTLVNETMPQELAAYCYLLQGIQQRFLGQLDNSKILFEQAQRSGVETVKKMATLYLSPPSENRFQVSQEAPTLPSLLASKTITLGDTYSIHWQGNQYCWVNKKNERCSGVLFLSDPSIAKEYIKKNDAYFLLLKTGGFWGRIPLKDHRFLIFKFDQPNDKTGTVEECGYFYPFQKDY